MNVYSDIAGRIPRPSTRATKPAHPTNFFGRFGVVRHEAKGRWAELAIDLVPRFGPRSETRLVLSTRHSEDPCHYSCATMSLSEAREVRALLDRAIEQMEGTARRAA